jgi:hypothetical protein
MRCLLARNLDTYLLKNDIAAEMEELRIYAEEFVEFHSRFRDQDTEMHCHPSLHLILFFGSAARCQKCGFSASFAKFFEDGRRKPHQTCRWKRKCC